MRYMYFHNIYEYMYTYINMTLYYPEIKFGLSNIYLSKGHLVNLLITFTTQCYPPSNDQCYESKNTFQKKPWWSNTVCIAFPQTITYPDVWQRLWLSVIRYHNDWKYHKMIDTIHTPSNFISSWLTWRLSSALIRMFNCRQSAFFWMSRHDVT